MQLVDYLLKLDNLLIDTKIHNNFFFFETIHFSVRSESKSKVKSYEIYLHLLFQFQIQ